jgi:hypothetical protein
MKPDATAMFAAYMEHRAQERAVEDALRDTLSPWEWDYFRFDYYDASVEFRRADNDMRLTTAQQEWLWSLGFRRTWICHIDGSESFYSVGDRPGKPGDRVVTFFQHRPPRR